jgi:hypothetical protein
LSRHVAGTRMKTSHQLARELLAGPDLPCWHFDPSRAGLDDEQDTSLSVPDVQVVDPADGLSFEAMRDAQESEHDLRPFITLSGDTEDSGEALSDDEQKYHAALDEIQAMLEPIAASGSGTLPEERCLKIATDALIKS